MTLIFLQNQNRNEASSEFCATRNPSKLAYDAIQNTMVKFPGNFDFKLSVFDADEKMDVLLLSRNQKVASTNDFVKELKEIVKIP